MAHRSSFAPTKARNTTSSLFEEPASESEPSDSENESADDLTNLSESEPSDSENESADDLTNLQSFVPPRTLFVPPNLTELTKSAPIAEEDPKEEKIEEPASESEPSDSENESVDDLANLQSHGQVPSHSIPDEKIGQTAAGETAGAKNMPQTETNTVATSSAPRADKVTKLLGSELFKMQAHASLYQHKLAAIHLAAWQYWVFTIPMAVIAMATGILAFVATTELFSKNTNSILNCIVGSLSFLTVFMQTLSSQCMYDVRASMHESTAVDLRDLREDLDSTSRKESVLMGHGGDDNSKKPGKTLEEEFDTIVKRYNQCLKGCKSTVPIKITDAFNKFESKLDTTWSLVGTAKLREIYGDAYHFKVIVQGYDSLAAAYSCYWMWPFILRNPIKVVDETMEELKETIWDSKDYWDFEKTPLLSRNKLVGQHSSDTVEKTADTYV